MVSLPCLYSHLLRLLTFASYPSTGSLWQGHQRAQHSASSYRQLSHTLSWGSSLKSEGNSAKRNLWDCKVLLLNLSGALNWPCKFLPQNPALTFAFNDANCSKRKLLNGEIHNGEMSSVMMWEDSSKRRPLGIWNFEGQVRLVLPLARAQRPESRNIFTHQPFLS